MMQKKANPAQVNIDGTPIAGPSLMDKIPSLSSMWSSIQKKPPEEQVLTKALLGAGVGAGGLGLLGEFGQNSEETQASKNSRRGRNLLLGAALGGLGGAAFGAVPILSKGTTPPPNPMVSDTWDSSKNIGKNVAAMASTATSGPAPIVIGAGAAATAGFNDARNAAYNAKILEGIKQPTNWTYLNGADPTDLAGVKNLVSSIQSGSIKPDDLKKVQDAFAKLQAVDMSHVQRATNMNVHNISAGNADVASKLDKIISAFLHQGPAFSGLSEDISKLKAMKGFDPSVADNLTNAANALKQRHEAVASLQQILATSQANATSLGQNIDPKVKLLEKAIESLTDTAKNLGANNEVEIKNRATVQALAKLRGGQGVGELVTGLHPTPSQIDNMAAQMAAVRGVPVTPQIRAEAQALAFKRVSDAAQNIPGAEKYLPSALRNTPIFGKTTLGIPGTEWASDFWNRFAHGQPRGMTGAAARFGIPALLAGGAAHGYNKTFGRPGGLADQLFVGQEALKNLVADKTGKPLPK